ncbi:MAG: site-specific DNA-methyltransferase [Planctomycetota bacterium]|nr:MAG: site-specific DNA-methyltransferase [Planctomycetota bacterium]
MGQQLSLFTNTDTRRRALRRSLGQTREQIKRIDLNEETRKKILPLCRLGYGEIWEDPVNGHRVGVLDATKLDDVKSIMEGETSPLMINDPPYNVRVGNANTRNLSKTSLETYLDFSRRWVRNAIAVMKPDAHFYVWMGTDYKDNFQPLPDFMIMMRDFKQLRPRNLITMRNQRGYGTQKNWMWVRQELLYYVQGEPSFSVVYTDIPKVVKGYYKKVNGELTENLERSKSNTIRPGNVWFDIQQVFYRMEENVSGCYAQKPIKAIERIIESSSTEGDLVVDFFAHSGTTLIAGEKLGRRVYTFDIDPVFAEITIRRLENYRRTGRTGWQWHSQFPEIEE